MRSGAGGSAGSFMIGSAPRAAFGKNLTEGGRTMTYDLLIKNARVVDGSGEPSFQADVAVHQGKIVGVGKYNGGARRTIDAGGRVVAPGFIDHPTHLDPHAF